MSASFPSSVPNYPIVTGSEVLGLAGSGRGLAGILTDHGDDIKAVASKIGSGASTPSAGTVMRATGAGTSAWGALNLATDVSDLSALTAVYLLDPTAAKLRAAMAAVGAGNVSGTAGSVVFSAGPTIASPTLTTPTIASFTNATHNHYGAAGGGALDGWFQLPSAPTTVTVNGNRSYSLTFSATDHTDLLSKGMRIRTTRQTAAPTRCTNLNGSTQYWSKSSPSGMTFTDDFAVSAWIKVGAYKPSGDMNIASRYNGTSGWRFGIDASGRVFLSGYNAGAANYSTVLSKQSVPVGVWVHVAAQLDMSSFTATSSTSWATIDGLFTPAEVLHGGTNPTALVQAGDLQIGAANSTDLFNGKIAQVAIFNAKISDTAVRFYMSQGLLGTETSRISMYSFDNTSNDLASTANNLTASGSAVATAADSPFGNQADGSISSSYDYAVITDVQLQSGQHTVATVQCPEGCTIARSGSLTTVDYSTSPAPYNFPNRDKWRLRALHRFSALQVAPTLLTWYNLREFQMRVPTGDWRLGYSVLVGLDRSVVGRTDTATTLSTSASAETDTRFTSGRAVIDTLFGAGQTSKEQGVTVPFNQITPTTPYYLLERATHSVSAGNLYLFGVDGSPQAESEIYAIPDCL